MLFASTWREMLEQTQNVSFYQDMVRGLLVKDSRCFGIISGLGHEIRAKAVVLTSGTFLNGIIHIGEKQLGGGRISEKASTGITEQLVELGFESDRLKTGTPPRIDGRSLDYSKMEEQKGDEEIVGFSFIEKPALAPSAQKSCHITYTNQKVHDILKTGFDRSPMYQGRIHGTGPRYCPSVEDKINRFAERDRHQLFVEPEGWNTVEIYVNGFSTSYPNKYNSMLLELFLVLRIVKCLGLDMQLSTISFHPLNYSTRWKPSCYKIYSLRVKLMEPRVMRKLLARD
jgi:tRNA uridine 5-carboxymethylaminomethyl modification enzyme